MSDYPQGENWWIASDSKWYPPELHPDYVQPTAGQDQNNLAPGYSLGNSKSQDMFYSMPQGIGNQYQTNPQYVQNPAFSSQTPYTAKNPALKFKPKWIIAVTIPIVIIILAVVGLSFIRGNSGTPWVLPGVTAVADPAVFGNVVVILESTPADNLEIVGLNANDGKQLWSFPYSNSGLTQGEPVTVNIINGIVVDLNPDSQYPMVVAPQGINVSNGTIAWTLPKQILWDEPAECTQDSPTLICMTSLNLNTNNSGLNEINSATGTLVRYIPNISRMLGAGIFQTSSNTPTLEQLNNDGTVAWLKSAQSLFNQNVSPNVGWNTLAEGNLDIISLASIPSSSRISPLLGYTVGVNIASGRVVWSQKGIVGCGIFTQSPLFICTSNSVFSAHQTSDGPTTEITFSGLNAQTGQLTWSVQTYSGYDFFVRSKIGQSGTDSLLVNQNGSEVILNLATGQTTPTNATSTYWCVSEAEYKSNTDIINSAGNIQSTVGTFIRSFVLSGCNNSLKSVSHIPNDQPFVGGATYNHLYIFAEQNSLVAISI